ncbi:MAG: hypothetical protein JSR73_05760 [Proteobacteria bacterium]|nr:hypothetical protein [Pseudomonadota bacterium]
MVLVIVVSFLVVGMVMGLGIASARAVASLPIEVLSRAADAGLYAGLAPAEAASPAEPSQGIPVREAAAA